VSDEHAKWGAPEPLYPGSAEVFEDLRPESPGLQRWVKDARGRGWYPSCCPTHTPKAILAEQDEDERRDRAERVLAKRRGTAYHPPEPEPVQAEQEPEPEAPPSRPVTSDDQGERLLARWIARMIGYGQPPREPWE
jgi:hypothetical protein